MRRALALAIDRKKVAEVTFSGMLLPATGILPPQLPGYHLRRQDLHCIDPEAARAALAELAVIWWRISGLSTRTWADR